MIYLILYLLVGLIFTSIVDRIAKNNLPPENHFTDFEKFTIAALWPINIVIFAYNFIKSYNDSRKK